MKGGEAERKKKVKNEEVYDEERDGEKSRVER
jgi:hypothetical protein